MRIEVGDFDQKRIAIETHRIAGVTTAPRDLLHVRNDNNIAVVELRRPVSECHRILRLCYSNREHGQILGTVSFTIPRHPNMNRTVIFNAVGDTVLSTPSLATL
ncbi:uncharacterized protein LOC142339878 [Convolutriloba macropyga]|uniref:uncharacterized protein LOC142339878 n=1 Tax=Convolutriloba macropyga TaxID=536237 RepID=UPI003F51F4F2